MVGKKFIFIFLLIFLISFTSALGICNLDKETYHPGETATFSCSCTLGNEKNIVGYIVFQNETSIMQSVLTTSGDCINSIFGDSFVFPVGADYTGNTTFSANADGSGTPSGWSNVGDIISDDFTAQGAHVSDCIIVDIVASQNITIGGTSSVKIKVEDSISGEKIIHASCIADAYDINSLPLIFEPNSPGNLGYKHTTSEGEVGFTHDLVENFWEINTSYLFEFHCFSLPNSSFSDVEHIGWLADSGEAAGMKSCATKVIFTTNGEDIRPEVNLSSGQAIILLGTLFVILFIALIFFVIAITIRFKPVKIFLWGLGSIFTIFALGTCVLLLRTLFNLFDGIITSYVQMYFLVTILTLAAFFALIIYLIIVALESFRIKRGLKDIDDD